MPKRKLCDRCERPLKTCLCDSLVTMKCDFQLIILQDPKEAKHALSSAPILAKSIAEARLIVGEEFNPIKLMGENWQKESLLIYPSENSLSIKQAQTQDFKYLILLDGTWKKVSRLLHLNPWLMTLSCFAIPSSNASEYKIRKSPREDGLSTIEAGVEILNHLHNQQDYSPVLLAFKKMISFQIEAMGEETFNNNYPQ